MAAPPRLPQETAPLGRRLIWFVALWFVGVGTVAAVAFILRLWIAPH